LSITSTMLGSSRYAAIDGPSAVRSMRAPRAKASERNETAATTNPAKSPHAEADRSTGLIRKSRKWVKATSLMGKWGPGIERHTQGTDAAAAMSFLCITLGWWIGHAEPGYGCKAPILGAPVWLASS
jgi:anaerobic selenocysteine-containing dehydrogenase